MDLKLTPSSTPFFLSACRMARGHEEVSTSQVKRRRGTPWETPTSSNLVATYWGGGECRLFYTRAVC